MTFVFFLLQRHNGFRLVVIQDLTCCTNEYKGSWHRGGSFTCELWQDVKNDVLCMIHWRNGRKKNKQENETRTKTKRGAKPRTKKRRPTTTKKHNQTTDRKLSVECSETSTAHRSEKGEKMAACVPSIEQAIHKYQTKQTNITGIGRGVPKQKSHRSKPGIPPARIPEIALWGRAGITWHQCTSTASICRASENEGVKRWWDI